MPSQTPEQKAAAQARWPNINAALEREPMLKHLNDWTKTHPATGRESLLGMRQEMYNYLVEQFLTAPPKEVADALAEMVSADLMKRLVDMSEQMIGSPKDNPDSFAE